MIISNGVIIDGHNRYDICIKHNRSFKTKEKKFKNDDEKIIWIIDNQLARRNLSTYDRIRLTLKQEEVYKNQAKEKMRLSTGRGKKGLATLPNVKGGQVGLAGTNKPLDTRQNVADITKVGARTVAKVKVIEKEADEKTKKKLSEQKVTINKVYKDTVKKKKREAIGKNNKKVPLPKKKYNIIYADPPWNFKHYSDKGRATALVS